MNNTMPTAQIPFIPKPGDIWFYIDLTMVDHSKIPGLFALLETLGLPPRLAYRARPDDLEICLLLHHGFLDGMTEPPQHLYGVEQRILANALDDPGAMHFMCGLNRSKPAIAA